MASSRRPAFATALLLVLFAGTPGARAQAPSPADPAVWERAVPTAPVEVDGVVLYYVRGASAFPAELRASRRARVIVEAAQDPKVDPGKLEIVETDRGIELKAGGHDLGLVLEADARLEGLTVYELALAQREAVEAVIVRYRNARTPTQLATAAAQATALPP